MSRRGCKCCAECRSYVMEKESDFSGDLDLLEVPILDPSKVFGNLQGSVKIAKKIKSEAYLLRLQVRGSVSIDLQPGGSGSVVNVDSVAGTISLDGTGGTTTSESSMQSVPSSGNASGADLGVSVLIRVCPSYTSAAIGTNFNLGVDTDTRNGSVIVTSGGKNITESEVEFSGSGDIYDVSIHDSSVTFSDDGIPVICTPPGGGIYFHSEWSMAGGGSAAMLAEQDRIGTLSNGFDAYALRHPNIVSDVTYEFPGFGESTYDIEVACTSGPFGPTSFITATITNSGNNNYGGQKGFVLDAYVQRLMSEGNGFVPPLGPNMNLLRPFADWADYVGGEPEGMWRTAAAYSFGGGSGGFPNGPPGSELDYWVWAGGFRAGTDAYSRYRDYTTTREYSDPDDVDWTECTSGLGEPGSWSADVTEIQRGSIFVRSSARYNIAAPTADEPYPEPRFQARLETSTGFGPTVIGDTKIDVPVNDVSNGTSISAPFDAVGNASSGTITWQM